VIGRLRSFLYLLSGKNIRMLRYRLHLLFFILLVNGWLSQAQETSGNKTPALNVVFTGNENDLIPEGLAYDALKKDFYVSSTYKRKIIKINPKGEFSDFIKEQQDGISGVIGMRVDQKRRILWAVSSNAGNDMPVKDLSPQDDGVSGIFKYDLTSGKLQKKYLLSEKGRKFFFNDLTVDRSGNVFLTDTMNGGIYRIDSQTDNLTLFYQLPEIYHPNGIAISDNDRSLFVAVYSQPENQFIRLDVASKKMVVVDLQGKHKAGADGLYFYNNSLVAVLPGSSEGKVVQYFMDDQSTKVNRVKIHLGDDPLLMQPSTGAIAGKKFYFIATTNLQLFRKLYNANQGVVNPKDLAPLRIGVVDLE
jgi:sugar lactone lactonase YvrE